MGKTKEIFMQMQEQNELLDDEYYYEKYLASIDKSTFSKQSIKLINEEFYPQLKTKTNDKH